MTKKQPDITYAVGFIRARLVALDESTGSEVAAPGVFFRIRAGLISMYHAGEPGVTVLTLATSPDLFYLYGSVEDMDKAMERHHMVSHEGGGVSVE